MWLWSANLILSCAWTPLWYHNSRFAPPATLPDIQLTTIKLRMSGGGRVGREPVQMQPDEHISTSRAFHRRGQGGHYEKHTRTASTQHLREKLSASALSLADHHTRRAARSFELFTGWVLLTCLFLAPSPPFCSFSCLSFWRRFGHNRHEKWWNY